MNKSGGNFRSINRFYLIDFSRGIAALAIVIFHYQHFYFGTSVIKNAYPFYNIFKIFYEHGYLAVQFFFGISGFIFYKFYYSKIINNQIEIKDFFILRFSRIYPLHFITLIIVLILQVLFIKINDQGVLYHSTIDGYHFLLNLTLTSGWGIEKGYSFNVPIWSVSIEVILYTIFYLVAKKIKLSPFIPIIILLFFSVSIFKINNFISYGIFCFFTGGITCLIFEKLHKKNFYNKKGNILIFVMLLVIFFSIFIIVFDVDRTIIKILIFCAIFPLVIFLLAILQIFKEESGNKISFIGDISYSIYLVHYPFQILIIGIFNYLKIDFNYSQSYVFISYVGIVIFLSYLSRKFIEVYFQSLIRRRFKT